MLCQLFLNHPRKTGVHSRCYEKDDFNKLSEEQREEIFEHRKYLIKRRDRKRVKFSKNGQNFNESTMSKMVAKELEA